MTRDWLNHFHPDERGFADKAEEWIERAAERHTVKVTDFLDPRQAEIVQSLANRYSGQAALHFNGGYPEAERKRAVLVPDYRDPEAEDAGITILAVTSADDRIASLDHGDYMGALLGLGIKREKVGDFHVRPDGCHVLVAAEIADFLNLQLRQVGRIHVLTDILPLNELQIVRTQLEEMTLSVASMRLDGIVSDVCRLSRAKAQLPIQAGRCRVNWKTEEDPSKPLKAGDTVSVQGFGRFRILSAEPTKKERFRVKVGKFI
ncbi:YlmH family RNA-binding protein [Gorillibacterium timonense]|uniref:YlmH family RNA-binding protein n=1 Tax=Gorillibacterium timonense TaxID=1689269 RepID=UPI00071C7496|nr:YlmH/Sll1252 family protein [Gorillibacterium timonense]